MKAQGENSMESLVKAKEDHQGWIHLGKIVLIVSGGEAGLQEQWPKENQGRPVWRACNLSSFSPCLTGPVD